MPPVALPSGRLIADARAARPTHPTVSLVIPARNEADNLRHVLPLLPDCVTELVLVDGRSTDDTVAVTLELFPDAVIVPQIDTKGKGAAMIKGAIAASGDIVVYIDADGSMDPSEIPAFVGALEAGADLAKGSRFAPGAYSHDITPIRALGNWGLLTFANLLYRQRWSELNYGFFALWRDMLPTLGLADIEPGKTPTIPYGHGFEIETMTFTRAARSGLRVVEVASFEYQRIHGQSSLMVIEDGFRVLGALIKERMKPLTPVEMGDKTIATDTTAVADDSALTETTVSVIIAAHDQARLPLIMEGLAALLSQSQRPDKIVLVVDHNKELFDTLTTAAVDPSDEVSIVVVENHLTNGCSPSRNSGVKSAGGDIVIFLDDDAIPEPTWLEQLLVPFDDPTVAVVGGRLVPRWEDAQPSWWPESFNWTVGCTYPGMSKTPVDVRNVFGASLAVRRDVFDLLGGFGIGIGRLGDNGAGCEETEFSILARRRGGRSVYTPYAVANHFVPARRGTVRHFLRRCWGEGKSKALVAQRVGADDATETERSHLVELAKSMVSDVLHLRFARATMTALGTFVTLSGYAAGVLRIGGPK